MNKAALCFIVALSSSFAQSVSVGDGNVFFRGAAGSVKQITSEHLDSDPSLSFDNKQIVFVRRTPGRQTGDLDENEIWIADCDHFRPAKRILRGRQGNISPGPRMLLAEFSKP